MRLCKGHLYVFIQGYTRIFSYFFQRLLLEFFQLFWRFLQGFRRGFFQRFFFHEFYNFHIFFKDFVALLFLSFRHIVRSTECEFNFCPLGFPRCPLLNVGYWSVCTTSGWRCCYFFSFFLEILRILADFLKDSLGIYSKDSFRKYCRNSSKNFPRKCS